MKSNFILFLKSFAEFVSLFIESVCAAITPPFRIKDFYDQFVFVVNESLIIIVFCVSFAAAVTIIESSYHMKIVIQNAEMVPGLAAVLILRELGTVLAMLLVTSRVGAGIAAEIGTMTTTEQIDALKMLGINPIRFLVVPRFWACFWGGVILSILANIFCLFAAMNVSSFTLGYTSGVFITAMKRFVSMQDLYFAMIKGGVFGMLIPIVSSFYGFRCKSGAEGVGHATTNAVVTSSVAIIILDFILTWIFSHFY